MEKTENELKLEAARRDVNRRQARLMRQLASAKPGRLGRRFRDLTTPMARLGNDMLELRPWEETRIERN